MKKIALAGNPNCGKTTLFNALTGSNQYTGNWPGVTVEKKEGRLRGNAEVIIQDLPGIYSLSPYSPEEVVSRTYLIDEHPDVVLNIVDASNLERNLYLSSQLMELGLPMVIALNMMDVLEKQGDSIDTKALSKKLGVPIISITAHKKDECMQAARAALQQAETQKPAVPFTFDRKIEQALKEIEGILPENLKSRWNAVKLLENDELVVKNLALSSQQEEAVNQIREALENKFDDDAESILTDQRYRKITGMLEGLHHRKEQGGLSISDKIDRIVTNRWLAIPIFLLVMLGVYWLSISTIGTMATDWVNDVLVGEWLQGGIGGWLESIGASENVISLVVDGIIGGVGAPLGFVPQMAVVFLCLSFLEDCGYMSRIAFVMDRIFRRFGLSGKSFISFMVSTGCGVPGIMSARTIEDERDRKMTMIVTTSMPCSAKLPVIAVIAGVITGSAEGWWVAWATYIFGIAAIILSALVLKHTRAFAGKPAPFIMELPAYHWPRVSNVLKQTWERCWHFFKKAGTILFVCCIATWLLVSYGFGPDGFGLVDVQDSLMASIGNALSWMFAPLGWGNWQAVAASLSGFVAKEQIVSTMGVLVNVADDSGLDPELWQALPVMLPSAAAAFSFLIFNMLDAPCLAAISTVAKEMNSRKWTWFTIVWQMFFAYTMALIVYQLGAWISTGSFTLGTAAGLVFAAWYIWMIFRPMPQPKGQTKKAGAAA